MMCCPFLCNIEECRNITSTTYSTAELLVQLGDAAVKLFRTSVVRTQIEIPDCYLLIIILFLYQLPSRLITNTQYLGTAP